MCGSSVAQLTCIKAREALSGGRVTAGEAKGVVIIIVVVVVVVVWIRVEAKNSVGRYKSVSSME